MRPLHETCGIYGLHEKHVAELQELAGDAAIAAATRLPHPYPADGARRLLMRARRERESRKGHLCAIENHGRLVGICGLRRIADGVATAGFWVGRDHQGLGIATHALRALVHIAFFNYKLRSVSAEVLADNAAARRVLEKCGFVEIGQRAHREPRWPDRVPLVCSELTVEVWRHHRQEPALAALHPDLRSILDAELAAGNEIYETHVGLPDADGVLVSLLYPFRALPSPLPANLVYREPNDPFSWRAEVSTRSPRHLLVC